MAPRFYEATTTTDACYLHVHGGEHCRTPTITLLRCPGPRKEPRSSFLEAQARGWHNTGGPHSSPCPRSSKDSSCFLRETNSAWLFPSSMVLHHSAPLQMSFSSFFLLMSLRCLVYGQCSCRRPECSTYPASTAAHRPRLLFVSRQLPEGIATLGHLRHPQLSKQKLRRGFSRSKKIVDTTWLQVFGGYHHTGERFYSVKTAYWIPAARSTNPSHGALGNS